MNVKHRILFVDDEEDITSGFKALLENEGFDVDAFNEPQLALEHFKPAYYNVILIDIRMPGMNGFELAKRIWAQDQDARICFMTAFEIYENEARKVFTNFKTHCFIKKPVAPRMLVSHIQQHLIQSNKP